MKQDKLANDLGLIAKHLGLLQILYADRYAHQADRIYLYEKGVDDSTLETLVLNRIVRDMGDYYSLSKDVTTFFNSRMGLSTQAVERDWSKALDRLQGSVDDCKKLHIQGASPEDIIEAQNHILDDIVDLVEDIESASSGIRNEREYTYKNERIISVKIRKLKALGATVQRLSYFQSALIAYIREERDFLKTLHNRTVDRKTEELSRRALSLHMDIISTNSVLLEYISRAESVNRIARKLGKVKVRIRAGLFERDPQVIALVEKLNDKPLDKNRNDRRKMPSILSLDEDGRFEGVLDTLPGKLHKIRREYSPPSPIPVESLYPPGDAQRGSLVDYDKVYEDWLGSDEDLYNFLRRYPFNEEMDLYRRCGVYVNLINKHYDSLRSEGYGQDEVYRYEIIRHS